MLGMERYESGVEAPGLGRRGGCQNPHQPAVHARYYRLQRVSSLTQYFSLEPFYGLQGPLKNNV